MSDSIVYEKSKLFAIRIVRLYQWLSTEKHEFVLSKQCLRSGTSIGANISEALHGQSRRDFTAKAYIALKECQETLYWLELLNETDYLPTEMYNSVRSDGTEIAKLLTSIIKTTKQNQEDGTH